MINKLTSFMTRQVPEGQMISYTYSVIDSNGNFTQRNIKGSFLVTDTDVMDHITALEKYITDEKLNGGL